MSANLKPSDVRYAVKDTINAAIEEFVTKPETNREDVIEWLDTENDNLFSGLVYMGRIDKYDVATLVKTAQPCAVILQVAQEDAWVEDDNGLWDGLNYGVLASMAFFSLRNLLYQGMAEAGYDTNKDQPFAVKATA